MNPKEMMRQARAMQERIAKEMETLRVEATAGGGVVRVSMNGGKEIVDLVIDKSVVESGDVEMLRDLVIAAVNEAGAKVDEAMKTRIGGGFPGLG